MLWNLRFPGWCWIRFKAHQIPSAKVNSTWNISVIGIPWTTLAEYSFATEKKKKSCPANRTTLRPKLQFYSWEMMAAISCPANSSWHFMPQQKEFAGEFVAKKLNRVLHVFCYHFLLSFFAPANNFKILHHCLSPNSF